MGVIAGWLVPHPPLIFPEVGHGMELEISDTVRAYREFADWVAKSGAELVAVISPHAGGGLELVSIMGDERGLDHGTAIPVRFIKEAAEEAGVSPPLFAHSGVSWDSLAEHYEFGQDIARYADEKGQRVVVVASGDLSHRLKADGPYGLSAEGPEFDEAVCEVCQSGDFSVLFDMDEGFCEKAGECGHRPLVVMAGALDSKPVSAELHSYEGPFGVGYGVGSFIVCREESAYVQLARETVESYVKSGGVVKYNHNAGKGISEEAGKTPERAGVFVSIKKRGALRGCIGTISPVTKSVWDEIRANAVSAAVRDPRFEPIQEEELGELVFSVDVLSEAEEVSGVGDLDPARYGVIVSLGGRRGLLLPNLEGIEDAEEQVSIAMQKAGIAGHERGRVKLQRFEVVRYH